MHKSCRMLAIRPGRVAKGRADDELRQKIDAAAKVVHYIACREQTGGK